MASFVENYRELAKVPEITSACINYFNKESNDLSVSVNWSCSDLVTLERTSLHSEHLVRNSMVIPLSVPVPMDKMILSRKDDSGNYTAHIYQDDDKCRVVVVKKTAEVTSFDLKALDVHGMVYSDSEFACLEWSPCGSKLLYVAEKKRIKATNFFTKPKSDDVDGRGKEYVYYDDWGEQLSGESQSVVAVLDLGTSKVSVHSLKDGLCPGQLVWTPNGLGIVGVALDALPFRLAPIYCKNRKAFLFYMSLDGSYYKLTADASAYIQAPRFSPDGSKLVYMKSPAGGPQIQGAQLIKMSWAHKEESVVIDYVTRHKQISHGGVFYGLQGSSRLVRRCWLSDNINVVFSALNPDKITTYCVNTDTGDMRCLKEYPLGSAVLLDVHQNWIAYTYSSLTEPPQICVGEVLNDGINVVTLTQKPNLNNIPKDWKDSWSITPEYAHPDYQYNDLSISILYFGPTRLNEGENKRPLICIPHGGPHNCFSNVYLNQPAFLVDIGYSVILVNYRGSTGCGTDSIHSLPGHCGTVDVKDVHQTVLSCLSRFPDVLDSTRVGLYGGSHGGFIVTHLAGQYPNLYKAVVARNPVTDISAMTTVTDLPDWTYVECGFKYDHKDIGDGEKLAKMFNMSPISHIDNVKAPTLLLVGRNDRCVPHYNGINYYKKLLARGVPTKLLEYDDCHPLRKVNVEADCLLNIASWFQEYV